MIFEVWDLIPEQERFSNKNIDGVCKILDKNNVNISQHSLKRWPPGGNTVDPWKKNKQHSDQLEAKKESDDESSKFIKVMFSIWQWQGQTFLSINRWTNLQIILGAMLFKDNPWSSAFQQQLMSNAALEGYFDIFILVYHLQHGYDFWLMLSHSCMCRNAGRMHPPRPTVGPFVLKLKCTLHRMNMGDNMNIIDDANTFLFKDLIRWVRRTFWGKHWAYNDEPFPAKYEMHVGMTWQFHDYGWPHILEWCFN